MAEKPSQRITTVSNKINVQQYMCVCLYASGNYRVNVLSERGAGLEMWWCLHTIRLCASFAEAQLLTVRPSKGGGGVI